MERAQRSPHPCPGRSCPEDGKVETLTNKQTETMEDDQEIRLVATAATERIQQLLKANNDELARRRWVETQLDYSRVLRDGLILRVRELENNHTKESVFAFLAGLCLGWGLAETLRWLLS